MLDVMAADDAVHQVMPDENVESDDDEEVLAIGFAGASA